MSIIIDLIILAIVVIGGIIGWKKGLFRSFMRLGIVVASAVCAHILSGPVSRFLSNNIIAPKLASHISGTFDKMADGKSLNELFSDISSGFSEWLGRYTTVEKANQWYSSTSDPNPTKLSNFLAKPIADTVSKVAAYVLLFLLLLLIFRIVCFFIEKVLKLPVLNGLNKTLGLFFGLIMGFCVAFIVSECISAAFPELAKVYPLFENSSGKSVIIDWISRLNPLKSLNIFSR